MGSWTNYGVFARPFWAASLSRAETTKPAGNNLGYALVMGKLDPGSRYPSHRHLLGEEVYILSGDLHIGDRALKAGDFHHADAGTTHGVNFSEQGCVILAVISTQDLQTQLHPAD